MQYAGTSWEELKWIRQAVGFLVHTNNRIFIIIPSLGRENFVTLI